MVCKTLVFSDHAINQMFKRDILAEEVRIVIEIGEVIAEYPYDKPYPSYLLLGFLNLRHLHVVIASDGKDNDCVVITAYEPTEELWERDFKTKKK